MLRSFEGGPLAEIERSVRRVGAVWRAAGAPARGPYAVRRTLLAEQWRGRERRGLAATVLHAWEDLAHGGELDQRLVEHCAGVARHGIGMAGARLPHRQRQLVRRHLDLRALPLLACEPCQPV